MGVRIARKHLGWYLAADDRFDADRQRELRAAFNALELADAQFAFIDDLFCPERSPGSVRAANGICAA